MDSGEDEEILSREELDALLQSLESGSGETRDSAAVGSSARPRAASVPVMRSMDRFAERESRRLSNLHQAPIHFSLIGWREVEQWEFAQSLLASDLALRFSMEPSGAEGFVVLGRPLLFSLLCANMGARPGGKRAPVPVRAYTRIERRFYRRFALDLLQELDRAWSSVVPVSAKADLLVERSVIEDRPRESLFFATFDVSGLGEICRLRVGIPPAPFSELERSARQAGASHESPIEARVLEMPVRVQAEVGRVELALSELAHLEVGEVLPVRAEQPGELVVRIDGVPKFRAVRGAVGRRLAIQLTERI